MTRAWWLLAVVAASLVWSLECSAFTNSGQLQGLYLGWVGHANLGDELVLDIFGHLLRDALLQTGSFQRASLEYQQPFSQRTKAALNFSAYDFAVLGGGSLLETSTTSRTDPCHRVRQANVPIYVHGTGTQLPYTRYDARNLGCVRPPVWGGLRGPLTHDLLANMSARFNSSITGRELPIFGDSGILADRIFPRVSWGIVGTMDKARARAGASPDPILCVSGTMQFGRPGTPDFHDTAELIEEWAKKFVVVLLPVDPVTAQKQEAMYQEAVRSGRVAEDHLFFNAHINHYGVWLALLARCDLVLTVRLHAAVMAAAAGAPFIMPYADNVSRKAKDFVLGTVGNDTSWQEYFLRQDEFDGSVAAVAGLLRTARTRAPRQRAAFNRAIAYAYESYLGSLKEFVRVIVPESFRFFAEVNMRIDRYFNSALFYLTFQ